MLYPESLKSTINSLKKIPGIGEKSAERYALSIFELDEKVVNELSSNLLKLKSEVHLCSICGHITDTNECSICSDENRNRNIICVVEDYKSVFMFEKSGSFNGVYHVLNGLISPIDDIYPDDINLSSLVNRIDNNNVEEVILALKPSIEGETTTLYIKKILENRNVKISRLSYGIPMGIEIDYLDSITLDRALTDRKEIS